MPSVLVETGFLTNANEGAYLNSTNGQTDMAASIAEAVLEYKNGLQSVSLEGLSNVLKKNQPPLKQHPLKKSQKSMLTSVEKNTRRKKSKMLLKIKPMRRQVK